MKYDLAQMQVPIDGSWKSVKKSAGNVLSIDMDKKRFGNAHIHIRKGGHLK